MICQYFLPPACPPQEDVVCRFRTFHDMQELTDTPLFWLAFRLGKFVLDDSGGLEIVLKGEDWQVHSFFLHNHNFDRK